MNEVDPSLRYTVSAVRSFERDGEPVDGVKVELSPIARQIATQYEDHVLSPVMVRGTSRIIEFALLCLTGALAYIGYVGIGPHLTWYYPLVIVLGSFITVTILGISQAYEFRVLSHPSKYIQRFLAAWSIAFALLSILGFLFKVSEGFSRVWFGTWYITGFITLILFRAIAARLMRRWARNGVIERRAVIVGGGKAAETLIRAIEAQNDNDIRICGIFDDRDDRRSPPIVAGYPKLGTINELIEFARIARIDMLIVSLPLKAEKRVLAMLKKLWVLPVDIRLSAHTHDLQFRPRSYSFIGKVPLLDIFDKPITNWDSVAKRAFDILFSLLGIIVFSPIMLATAIAIKLNSKGPILFKQRRHGFNNEIIEVYKFRSMFTEMCDPAAKQVVTRNDPRVTRVGRIIRKTSIDELPQFFNALFGSLSLVGPRPHAISAQSHDTLFNEVVDGYFARHRVKPGVTGWAQISGWRGEIDSTEKIRMRTEYDLDYIENWSLWFDLKILFLTPIRLMQSENAY